MNYRNAKYINTNGWIDCEIEHPDFGWIPYTLNPDDTDMTINNDELLAAMSEKNDVAAYVPPTQAELDAAAAEAVRAERDYKLLTEVDPIVSNPLRWADMTAEEQSLWAQYRTALLNVPQQDGFPHNITWPTKPE
jgi:hypothetical protein